MTVTPDGKNAYVVGGSSTSCCTVWQYNISPTTGALSPKSPADFTDCCGDPLDVAVTPDDRSAYVTASDFSTFPPIGSVAQYNIDPVSGALSPKTPESVSAGEGPSVIVVSPDGKSAYVADFELPAPGFIRQYNIDPATGALSPKTPSTLAAPDPINIALTSDGTHAYVVNYQTNAMSQYNIDPASGELVPQVPATVPTGSAPEGIAVTPGPRVPTNTEQCKDGGWQTFGMFKNQGDCVSYVVTHRKDHPG